MDIDTYLFKDEALKGEKVALKFRWILIIVVMTFIVVTFLKGHHREALLSLIPAGIFLFYNLYLGYLIKSGKKYYFLRYFSVTIDILLLTVHIYINSIYFSEIAVSTTASIFIYPILMFLSVLRYDKKLIIYATFLSILLFNLNYYLRVNAIDKDLVQQVISSDIMGHTYKSAYFLILGIFFLQVPDMVYRYIGRQTKILLKKKESEIKLTIEQKEKEFLKRNVDKLSQLNAELTTKNQKIEEQNLQLNELNRTNDKLLFFISHDLKNSFTTMASIIETFTESYTDLEDDDIMSALKVLARHSRNNYKLFDNLLQWASSKSGDIPLNKERINLSDLFNKQIDNYKESIKEKHIELKWYIPKDLEVYADRFMLESILDNLISNAVKFTSEGGKIEIDGIEGTTNSVLISIKDTGIGIPKENIGGLFEIGSTKLTKGTNGETGSGFGLILCKELVKRNGGDISVRSKPGEGSVISIIFPQN